MRSEKCQEKRRMNSNFNNNSLCDNLLCRFKAYPKCKCICIFCKEVSVSLCWFILSTICMGSSGVNLVSTMSITSDEDVDDVDDDDGIAVAVVTDIDEVT